MLFLRTEQKYFLFLQTSHLTLFRLKVSARVLVPLYKLGLFRQGVFKALFPRGSHVAFLPI